jgi:histidinol dehydrogenase
MLRIRIIDSSDARAVARLIDVSPVRDADTERTVRAIVSDVRRRGDAAVRAYARRFDGLAGALDVSRDEMTRAARSLDPGIRRAIAAAARNIRRVAERQVPRGWTVRVAAGMTVEQRVTPLDAVGCYVPAGRHPLPSSLLMTVIPAVAAGVGEIVALCPRPDPTVMAAAIEAGVTKLFRVGGAHAIAALAYGTRTIPRVDRIVGPGNRYVAAAKALIAADCAIDFYAGPSEVMVMAGAGRPSWIAADLLAQAEHDPDARAIFITWRPALARAVADAIRDRAPRSGPSREALRRHGAIILTKDREEAIDLVNRAAPEHLICESDADARRVRCAGSIFVGPLTVQAAGDYAIGSNHVLPTAGAARFRGGLSAADFVRVVTVQRMDRSALARLAPTVTTLARAEGLELHARSIEARFTTDKRQMNGRTLREA